MTSPRHFQKIPICLHSSNFLLPAGGTRLHHRITTGSDPDAARISQVKAVRLQAGSTRAGLLRLEWGLQNAILPDVVGAMSTIRRWHCIVRGPTREASGPDCCHQRAGERQPRKRRDAPGAPAWDHYWPPTSASSPPPHECQPRPAEEAAASGLGRPSLPSLDTFQTSHPRPQYTRLEIISLREGEQARRPPLPRQRRTVGRIQRPPDPQRRRAPPSIPSCGEKDGTISRPHISDREDSPPASPSPGRSPGTTPHARSAAPSGQ